MRHLALVAFVVVVVAAVAVAGGGCVVRGHPLKNGAPTADNGHNGGDNNGGDGNGNGDGDDPVDPDTGLTGAQLYGQFCASCHGDVGQGTAGGPTLQHWIGTRDALVDVIVQRMPKDDPSACDGTCAELVADFILENLQLVPEECADVDVAAPDALAPQTLRLLTRAEYRRSVVDLLGLAEMPCASTTDCDVEHESCVGGACRVDACGETTFLYDPPGSGAVNERVHVAGDFNDWPAQWANGIQLVYSDALGVWWGKAQIAPGSHTYKLVLDESQWIADPRSSSTSPDGFGGANSVLNVSCDGASSSSSSSTDDFAAHIPPDAHPDTFPFASHAASGLVTAVHVQEYLDASARAVSSSSSSSSSSPSSSSSSFDVRTFGRRAFRRPLTDAEVTRYTALLTSSSPSSVAQAMLSSPSFLYRSEIGHADAGAGANVGVNRLDPFEIATELSFLFWGTTPDDALLDAAAAGELDDADGIENEARRLLNDDRAREVMGEFALSWLGAERVRTVDKSPQLFPSFDAAVRDDLARETELYFARVMFESSGRYDELLHGTSSFVSARTAPLYGVNVASDVPTLVELPAERRGVLSQAAVLASTAHSNQTSPIRRGLFVRRRLLCQEYAAPPPNVASVPDVDPNATTRERFAQHTADPFCASCHATIDPVGFGFEGFDAVGTARATENGIAIDDSGDMSDVDGLGTGTHAPFSSMSELADILAQSPTPQRCFVRQAVRYVQGREPTTSTGDTCALEHLATAFADGDIQGLFIAIVRSPAFVLRRSP